MCNKDGGFPDCPAGVEFLPARFRESSAHDFQNNVCVLHLLGGFRIGKDGLRLAGVGWRHIDRETVHRAEGLQAQRRYLIGSAPI